MSTLQLYFLIILFLNTQVSANAVDNIDVTQQNKGLIMLSINSNATSLLISNQLNRSQAAADKAMERMSTGLRINSAKDDPAGMAIANRINTHIRGLEQASRNAVDTSAILSVLDDALVDIKTALNNMRDIALQSVNSTLSDDDRQSLAVEFNEQQAEVARVLDNTEFNNIDLFNLPEITIQVGSKAGETITLDLSELEQLTTSAALTSTIDTVDNAELAIDVIDQAIGQVNLSQSDIGALQSRLEAIEASNARRIESLEQAHSNIVSADMAKESAILAKQQIQQQVSASLLAQANAKSEIVLMLLRN